ncbi:hypothetical protein D3C74_310290 [compost metagenome]
MKENFFMIRKKYGVLLLFLVLSCIYTIIIDVCVGLPWNTFIINWRYTLFSLIERMIAVVLILLLVIPDLVRKLRRGKGMHSKSDNESPSGSNSG